MRGDGGVVVWWYPARGAAPVCGRWREKAPGVECVNIPAAATASALPGPVALGNRVPSYTDILSRFRCGVQDAATSLAVVYDFPTESPPVPALRSLRRAQAPQRDLGRSASSGPRSQPPRGGGRRSHRLGSPRATRGIGGSNGRAGVCPGPRIPTPTACYGTRRRVRSPVRLRISVGAAEDHLEASRCVGAEGGGSPHPAGLTPL